MTEVTGAAPPGETAIVVFVNVEEPSLARLHEYGPPVKRALTAAVLAVDSSRECQFQTSWGSLILPALRWATASSEPAGEMGLTQDPFLLWTSAAELCRTDGGRWSTLARTCLAARVIERIRRCAVTVAEHLAQLPR